MSKTAETAWIDIGQDDLDIVKSTPACEQPPGLHEKLDKWLAMD